MGPARQHQCSRPDPCSALGVAMGTSGRGECGHTYPCSHRLRAPPRYPHTVLLRSAGVPTSSARVHVCMLARATADPHTCTFAHAAASPHTCACLNTQLFTSTCVHACTYSCWSTYLHTQLQVYTRVYTGCVQVHVSQGRMWPSQASHRPDHHLSLSCLQLNPQPRGRESGPFAQPPRKETDSEKEGPVRPLSLRKVQSWEGGSQGGSPASERLGPSLSCSRLRV